MAFQLRSVLSGAHEQESRTYDSSDDLHADRSEMNERGMYLASSRRDDDGRVEGLWKSRRRTRSSRAPGPQFYANRDELDAAKATMRNSGLYLASVWDEPEGRVRAVWARQGRRRS